MVGNRGNIEIVIEKNGIFLADISSLAPNPPNPTNPICEIDALFEILFLF